MMKKQFVLMTLVVLALQVLTGRLGIVAAYGHEDIVVINEIAWAGSANSSADEWIELYNAGTSAVDLSGWYIEDDGSPAYRIESGMIGPRGYFLIVDNEDAVGVPADAVIALSLANSGDSLILKDASGIVMDEVNSGGGAWYAGDLSTKATMERINPEASGNSAENWASAVGTGILGTPGSVNSAYGGSGPAVYIFPAEKIASVGETVNFSLDISDAEDLYAYGFDIHYEPSILEFIAVEEDEFLRQDGAETAFNAALENGLQGKLVVGSARLENPSTGVDGEGTLFNLSFEVVGSSDAESLISFGAGSFLADSLGDLTALLRPASIRIASSYVAEVQDLRAVAGVERYSLELMWDVPEDGADSYIVRKQLFDGAYITLGQVAEPFFMDNNNVLPGVNYNYQVVAVRHGVESIPVAISASEDRGLKGDIDRSDRVDGRDVEKLARAFGSAYSEEDYDALADGNFDGIIDGSDLIDVGVNFGLTY